MKKKEYLKKGIENILIAATIIAAIIMGGMVDNMSCPIRYMMIPGSVIIANVIILIKYGKIMNED